MKNLRKLREKCTAATRNYRMSAAVYRRMLVALWICNFDIAKTELVLWKTSFMQELPGWAELDVETRKDVLTDVRNGASIDDTEEALVHASIGNDTFLRESWWREREMQAACWVQQKNIFGIAPSSVSLYGHYQHLLAELPRGLDQNPFRAHLPPRLPDTAARAEARERVWASRWRSRWSARTGLLSAADTDPLPVMQAKAVTWHAFSLRGKSGFLQLFQQHFSRIWGRFWGGAGWAGKGGGGSADPSSFSSGNHE